MLSDEEMERLLEKQKMRNIGRVSEVQFVIRKLRRHKTLTEYTELLSVVVLKLRQI